MTLATRKTADLVLPQSLRKGGLSLLRRAVIVILCAAILAQAAQTAVALRSATASADVPARESRGPGPATMVVNSTAQGVSSLVGAHLFGIPPASPDERAPEIGAAPVQWVLSGIIERSPPETGLAIIGESAQSTRLRGVGEEISRGFRLVQVRSEDVTIEHMGQRLLLRLTWSQNVPASGVKPLRAANVSRSSDMGSAQASSMGSTMAAIWHPPKGSPANRPPALALLKPQIHLDADGHYNGMRVLGDAGGRSLAQYGLARDDVITKINGRALTTPELAQQGLAQMSSGATVTLTVVRNGASQELPVTLAPGGG